MTDPSCIRTLIAEIEAGHVGRKESDEYLKLMGGTFKYGTALLPISTYTDPNGRAFYKMTERGIDWFEFRPHPLANAQGALESLPGGKADEQIFSAALEILDMGGNVRLLLAAAICLANLRRELAELEGG